MGVNSSDPVRWTHHPVYFCRWTEDLSRIARVVHVGLWRWRLTCVKNTMPTEVRTFKFKTNAVIAALDFLEGVER